MWQIMQKQSRFGTTQEKNSQDAANTNRNNMLILPKDLQPRSDLEELSKNINKKRGEWQAVQMWGNWSLEERGKSGETHEDFKHRNNKPLYNYSSKNV